MAQNRRRTGGELVHGKYSNLMVTFGLNIPGRFTDQESGSPDPQEEHVQRMTFHPNEAKEMRVTCVVGFLKPSS